MEALRRRWVAWHRSTAGLAATTAVITVVLVGASYGEAHPANPRDQVLSGHPVPHTPTAALLLVAAACLVLAGRRRWPVPTLALSTAAVAAYSVMGLVNGAALLAPTIALYSVSIAVSVRRALIVAAVTTGILMGAMATNNPFGLTGGGFDLIPFLMVAACLGGVAITSRRAYVSSIQTRAEQEARQRIDEERLRIARELHDVVAHTMATINVQAGVAAHLIGDAGGGPARDALVTIRDASKEGLQELRSILQVLRSSADADSTQPAPGAERIPSLIEGARASGLPVSLQVSGSPRSLPAAASLALYRIVQESLTNAIRHAPEAPTVVHLGYREEGVEATVTNAAAQQPVAASDGAGHGLLGMRERAHSIGGQLEAGPAQDGGWQTRVWLPAPAGHPPAPEDAARPVRP